MNYLLVKGQEMKKITDLYRIKDKAGATEEEKKTSG
jgi:hypothetical protein